MSVAVWMAIFTTIMLVLMDIISVVELIEVSRNNELKWDGKIVFVCLFLLMLTIVAFTIVNIWRNL